MNPEDKMAALRLDDADRNFFLALLEQIEEMPEELGEATAIFEDELHEYIANQWKTRDIRAFLKSTNRFKEGPDGDRGF